MLNKTEEATQELQEEFDIPQVSSCSFIYFQEVRFKFEGLAMNNINQG